MLNLNKVGRPRCKIEGGKCHGLLASVSDHRGCKDDDDNDPSLFREFKQLKIANESKFQQVPDTTKEREILYITGPSGSGKSTYTRKFLEQYTKKHKEHPVYLFSSLPSDESLDKIKPKRFKLDDTMRSDPIKIEELASSVCSFEDIDAISDEDQGRRVQHSQPGPGNWEALQDHDCGHKSPPRQRQGHQAHPQRGPHHHLLP